MKAAPKPVAVNNAPGRQAIPAGYHEVLYWRIGDKRWQVIVINLVALLSLVPWLLLFNWLGAKVGGMPQSGDFGPLEMALIVAGILLTALLHELAHALAMTALGAKVRFGVLWTKLMLYATAPGHVFRWSAFIIAGLAPLVGLSLLSLLGMILMAGTPWVNLLAFCAAGNAAMSSGDLWILGVLLRVPSCARVIDEQDGMRILLPAPQGTASGIDRPFAGESQGRGRTDG